MLKQAFATILIGSAVLLTACTTVPTPKKTLETFAKLENKNWVLTEIGATTFKVDPKAHNAPSIQFSPEYRVSGADGCNRFAGGYNINADKIVFTQLIHSQMYCVNTQDLAKRFNKAIEKTNSFQLYDDTLRLLDAQGNPVLLFKAN